MKFSASVLRRHFPWKGNVKLHFPSLFPIDPRRLSWLLAFGTLPWHAPCSLLAAGAGLGSALQDGRSFCIFHDRRRQA